MIKLLKKYFVPINIFLLSFSILVLIADTVIYPGVVKKHIFVNSSSFALLSSMLIFIFYTYFSKHNIRKLLSKVVYILSILLLPFVVTLSLLEIFNYPNYIFSHYHVDPHSLHILGLFFIVLLILDQITIGKKIFSNIKHKNWIIITFSIAFSVFLIAGNLKARWSFVDDHEIVNFLGSDQKIKIFEIPELVSKTEVSKWGESVRYRPSYYVLRIFESYFWRGNLQLWHLARIAFLALFLYVLVKIISEKIMIFAGFAFASLIMRSSYWPEILIKLGPAEIYGILGLTIYAYSFYTITKNNSIKNSSIFSWLGIFIGGIVSSGSKENLIIFILPSIYLLIRYFNYKKISFKIVFPLLHILYSLFIGLGIYLSISKVGHDVYMNTITLKDRWMLFVNNISKTAGLFFVKDLFLTTLIVYLWQLRKIPFRRFISMIKNTAFLLIFLFFAYLSQVVYYGGGFPNNSRYDFPAILIKQIFIFVWIGGLFYLMFKYADKKVAKLSKIAVVILSIYIIFNSFISGFGNISSYIEKNVASTNNFSSHLDMFVKTTSSYPNYPVIFRSRRIWDYEHVFSIYRYINFLGVKNDLYLDYEDKNINDKTGLEKYLSETLIDISVNGMSNERLNMKPYVFRRIETNCIDYNMSYIKENSKCVEVKD